MRLEFKLLANVMAEFLPDSYPYTIAGVDSSVKSEDFDERVDVLPVSNPNIFSQAQRIALAQTKMQMATTSTGSVPTRATLVAHRPPPPTSPEQLVP